MYLQRLVSFMVAVFAASVLGLAAAQDVPQSDALPARLPEEVAPAPPQRMVLHLDSILATQTDAGIDPRLDPDTQRRLQNSFDFPSYSLVDREQDESWTGERTIFWLPGGLTVQMTPEVARDGRLDIELAVFEGATERADMAARLVTLNGKTVVLGGWAYQNGWLILVLSPNIEANSAS